MKTSIICVLCALLYTIAALNVSPTRQLFPIALRSGTFYPTIEKSVSAMAMPVDDNHVAWIVQCERGKTSAIFKQLPRRRVHYLPTNNLLVELSQREAHQVAALPGVAWVGLYPHEHKIEPELSTILASNNCNEKESIRLQIAVAGSSQSSQRLRQLAASWALDRSITRSVSGSFVLVEVCSICLLCSRLMILVLVCMR